MTMYGCPLCDDPPPHSHDLGVILNARYFCADGSSHQWGPPSRWLKRQRCIRCQKWREKESVTK